MNTSDLTKIDYSTFNPDTVSLGTAIQDCSIIAQTFERGAHSTPTEAAVFAGISRSISNTKSFSLSAKSSLSTYLRQPQDEAKEAVKRSEQLSAVIGGSGGGGGDSTLTDHVLQAINVGPGGVSTLGDSFGDSLLDMVKDCIPCTLRMDAFLELHPHIDLLNAFEADIKARLSGLTGIGNLLNNFDMYGDFCGLMGLLSFICIPDLQRIIVLLMALMTLEVPRLDGIIGLLQALIAPIFSPILISITSLLDQFVSLVTAPLECVIDALNQQMKKLGFEIDPRIVQRTQQTQAELQEKSQELQKGLNEGLSELNKTIAEAKKAIEDKLAFYIAEIKAFMGEMGDGDVSYINLSLKKLKLLRMISFIQAIIKAVSSGHAACSPSGKPPEIADIDNFFNTYLNPNSAFNTWIDDTGQLHLDEKVEGFDVVVNSPTSTKPLSTFGNVLQFEGDGLVDSSLAQSVESAVTSLTSVAHIVMPCKLETSVTDANKVNQWIEELNRA